MEVHPLEVPYPAKMITNYPIQSPTETLDNYYLRFIDYLQLQAIIKNVDATLNDLAEQDIFLNNAQQSTFLMHKAAQQRVDPRYYNAFTATNFLYTVNKILMLPDCPLWYPQTSKVDNYKTRWNPNPQRNNPKRNEQNFQGTKTNPIPINHLLISNDPEPWIDDIPKDDDEAEANIGKFQLAVNRIGIDRTSANQRPCIFCKTNHNFNECPVIQNKDYLQGCAIRLQQLIEREAKARASNFSNTPVSKIKTNSDFQMGQE